MKHSTLVSWGWGPRQAALWEETAAGDSVPARVVRVFGTEWELVTPDGLVRATTRSRLRHHDRAFGLPAVGDWVALDPATRSIEAVLPRSSLLVRKAAGDVARPQVLAANLDWVMAVMAVDNDFNLRRLERYLAVIAESGARPLVVLSKCDLLDAPDGRVAEVRTVAPEAEVMAVSSTRGDGIEALEALLRGQTAALVGSSGAGKSTLLNRLVGSEAMATTPTRAHDGRGQHTTTQRVMFQTRDGALVIDTPGMRELGLWDVDEGIDRAFEDVTALCAQCQFRDCSHGPEKGCAVRAALERGSLPRERYAAWDKLRREATAAQLRGDKQAQAAARAVWKRRSQESAARAKLKRGD